MKRREFFKSATALTAGTAAAGALAMPAIAQGNMQLAHGHDLAQELPGPRGRCTAACRPHQASSRAAG